MNTIAFFDFDGTITTKDTLLEILKFRKGRWGFYIGFALQAPWLVAYKLGLISNQTAKEKVLAYFFKNMPVQAFQNLCDDFAAQQLPQLIRPKALAEIEKLKALNATIVIVSASAENWIAYWCRQHQLELMGTRLQVHNNCITGNIEGANCYGEEKVRRIKERYNLQHYQHIYCYGDTKGDKAMLALATLSYYTPFR